MISRITGVVVQKTQKYAIVEVAGIGYKIYSSPQVLAELGAEEVAQVWTYLVVRENALDLYGFLLKDELDFFELLISISGIGPKGAIGILSVTDINTLNTAISSGDTSYLTKVSGIGRKSAEKIVLELKDKVGLLEIEGQSGSLKDEAETVEALKSLGYSHTEARDALKHISKDITGVSDRVRAALKLLGT